MLHQGDRRGFLKQAALIAGAGVLSRTGEARAAERPNIVWISTEDTGIELGCYGAANAISPNLDALAARGVRYTHAFTTSGVCAPVRSGIITGMYPTSFGTQHMRSGGSGSKRNIQPGLPDGVVCFPQYLREAGYHCANNSKEDYQFKTPASVWNDSSGGAHYRNRAPGQPFFYVRNFTMTHESQLPKRGDAHEANVRRLTPEQRQDPAKQAIPPYLPTGPETRRDWANYLELITAMDYEAGDILKGLEEDGLAEDTIVFFWGDHGVGLPRSKRWLYDSGTHIALIVYIPEKWRTAGQGEPGSVSEELVSSLDFAPTVLNLAGVPIPPQFQGRAFLGPNLTPQRDYVYGVRDRMDERYDIIRSVRDHRYRYIRNYEPYKAYYQYMNTAEKGPTMKELREFHAEGKLSPAAELFMADRKPFEELYDLESDPHELMNLAASPAQREVLERMRAAHLAWVQQMGDLSLLPEPELDVRAEKYGDRYAILRQPETIALWPRLAEVAGRAGECDPKNLERLTHALDDEDAAVRYWGAIGLGNLGDAAKPAEARLKTALDDPAAVTRVAAARALCLQGRPEKALGVLEAESASPAQWARLHAVTVLDEIEELARPAVPALKKALEDTDNKYVVRVANRALNQLLGTNNSVP